MKSRHSSFKFPAAAALIGLLAVFLAACGASSTTSEANAARWMPKPSTGAWQFQLQGKIDISIEADVYELDGFDVSAGTVKALHEQGRKVICYIDVGSWENYRSDRKQFPKSVRGNKYDGYPDERWLDIRKYRKFAKPLKARIAMCARKGFDGLEPDNINGYENPTGFPLTAKDQLKFNRWIAKQAHRKGLSVGLKNDGRQSRKLVKNYDFAVVEQCFQYNECGAYKPFIKAGKAVFSVEYESRNSEFCGRAKKLNFNAIGKEYDLYAKPFRPCVKAGA
ncbi:MAG: endo alpha-1,4 polygalactosaminidase [Solirubrobacterales bacterium]